jgi:hypothetical protein
LPPPCCNSRLLRAPLNEAAAFHCNFAEAVRPGLRGYKGLLVCVAPPRHLMFLLGPFSLGIPFRG